MGQTALRHECCGRRIVYRVWLAVLELSDGHESGKEEFPSNTAVPLALIAGGVTLLVFGTNASESLGWDIYQFFAG